MLHEIVQKIIELRARAGSPDVTTVDEVIDDLGVDRVVAVEALKKLEEKKLGEFIVGRGSSGEFKTRVKWHRSPSNTSQPGLNQSLARKDLNARTLKTYMFPLDAVHELKLELPRDLTTSEAERICQYVRSLVSL